MINNSKKKKKSRTYGTQEEMGMGEIVDAKTQRLMLEWEVDDLHEKVLASDQQLDAEADHMFEAMQPDELPEWVKNMF